MVVIFFFSFQPYARPFRSKIAIVISVPMRVCASSGRRVRYTPRVSTANFSFIVIVLCVGLACVLNSLTSNGGRRKNRNIGGTACTIKRAGVVNDSAPESCAVCVFGAFFGGSTSHHRVFFMPVFFSHAVSLLGDASVRGVRAYVRESMCVSVAGGKHLALDFCAQIS